MIQIVATGRSVLLPPETMIATFDTTTHQLKKLEVMCM
jgi:hypothetical protein